MTIFRSPFYSPHFFGGVTTPYPGTHLINTMTHSTLNRIGLLALPMLISASLDAATFSDPVGVVKITIAAAPAAGQSKLTALSATLRGAIDYQATATSIGTFAGTSQPLNTGVTTWTATQWTAEPHLCYIENAAGAEEAYLITAMDNSTGVLTLATTFDFSTRYPATPTYRICKANTLGSLFGTTTVPFYSASSSADADVIYAWDGSGWDIFWHNGSTWKKAGLFGSADGIVIFPDDGLFVKRTQPSEIVLTLSGSVATKAQISTIPGSSSSFIGSRYPVGTTVNSLGLNNLPNWLSAASSSDADRFYVWNDGWAIYWHNGTTWKKSGLFGNADNEPIAADSAIFVQRFSSSAAEDSANAHPLPYTP